MTNAFILDLKDVNNEQASLNTVDVLVQALTDDKTAHKEIMKDFYSKCLSNLESESSEPKLKFYTVMMLKELTFKEKLTLRILSSLSSHPLYGYLEELIFRVDPKKAISQKGKGIFPRDPETGNAYIRVLLQACSYWGTKFPMSSSKEPTKFRKTLNRLIQEQVTLPKQFQYFPNPYKERLEGQRKVESKRTPGGNETMSKVTESKEKSANEIKFMYNKIEALLNLFDDVNEAEQLEREIQSNHLKFEKELQKFTANGNEMIDNQPEDIIVLYFKVSEFLNREDALFKTHKNDAKNYATAYEIAFEQIFEDKEPPPKGRAEQKPPAGKEKPANSKMNSKQNDQKAKYSSQPGPMKVESQVSRPNEGSKINPINKNIILSCFQPLEEKSKSPFGFKAIKQSLDKQKKSSIGRSNINRSKSPISASKVTNKLGKSSVNTAIFSNPPNSRLSTKNFEGQLVHENFDMNKALSEIRPEQGSRRFKTSNFGDKYVLYEDEVLQVGYKSQQIYERVSKFSAIIGFKLYLGNKTDSVIQNLRLQFKGDKNSLLYTFPKVIDEFVAGNTQNKLEMMVVPRQYPFQLYSLRISYTWKRNPSESILLFPNTMLKLAVYLPIQKYEFVDSWRSCAKIYKTDTFKLSKDFPPNTLSTSCIKQLIELTSYEAFKEEGSTMDYELACNMLLEQSYEGILKITVRPNLFAVVQVGVMRDNEEYSKRYTFFLQTMMMLLKDQYA